MSKSTVVEFKDRETITDPLSEMLKAGAKQLIHQAVEAELAGCYQSMHTERRGTGDPLLYAMAISQSETF